MGLPASLSGGRSPTFGVRSCGYGPAGAITECDGAAVDEVLAIASVGDQHIEDAVVGNEQKW